MLPYTQEAVKSSICERNGSSFTNTVELWWKDLPQKREPEDTGITAHKPHLISLCLNAQDVLFKHTFIVNACKALEKGELVWPQVIIAGIELGAQSGVGIYIQ